MPRPMTRTKNYRDFPLVEFKALNDVEGVFEGYLATFGNEDLGGDIIQSGAFTKTINDLKAKQAHRKSLNAPSGRYMLPIFWNHNPDIPIGGFTELREDKTGLFVRAELDMDKESGRDAYSGLSKGYVPGMSIGYFNVKAPTYKQGVRYLVELALIEGSPTAIPMNEEALALDVKNQSASSEGRPQKPANYQDRKARDFDTLFQSLAKADDLQDEWGDMFIAFTHAMSELMWQLQAQTNGWVMEGSPTVDGQEAAKANIDAFSTALLDLVSRSEAAAFSPSLDSDGDQFLDPDGCNADDDDDDYGMMSDGRPRQVKAGRVMSSANHTEMGNHLAEMGKSLDAAKVQYKALSDMHAQMAPKLDGEPSADGQDTQDAGKGGKSATIDGAGAGAAPDGALAGNTTPDDSSDDQLSESAREKLLALKAAQLRRQLAKVGA